METLGHPIKAFVLFFTYLIVWTFGLHLSSIERWRRKGRGGRRKAALGDEWLDCPELGKGWKKKVIYLRTGSVVPRKIMNYMSPKGFRVRSKKELNRRVKVDLTHFDFNQGMFVDGIVTTKKRRSRSTRSQISPSSADAPDRDVLCNPDTPFVETPQRPHLTPKCATTPLPSNEPYSSPLQLTQVSPTTQQAPQPSLSPSLGLGDFSPQILSDFTTPEKDKTAFLSHSWLQSPLAPVSPTETPEKDPPMFLSALKSSPDFRLPVDGNAALNGGQQENGLSYKTCANCGCKYPSTDTGDKLLCPQCTIKVRRRPPHIIFKKVGQDKWIVGKRKSEGFLKKKIPPLGKKLASKSVRLLARKEKEKITEMKEPDSEEDDYVADGGDDDDDDDAEFGPRKRNRRMCGQCKACLRNQDCGKCDFCMDKPKFGGHNKKRQKCRLRQCKFHSRLKTWRIKYKQRIGLVDEAEDDKGDELEIQKRSRPRKKRNLRRPWDNDFMDNEDGKNEGEEQHPGNKGQQSRRRKWRHSLKEEDEDEGDEMGGPGVEEDGLEEIQFVVGDDGDSVFYEEVYPSSYRPSAQNGTMEIVESSSGQPGVGVSSQPSQDWVCTVAGLPEGSQVLGSGLNLNSSGPLQFSDISLCTPVPVSNILTSNAHLGEVMNTNWLDLIRVETAMPQVIEAPQPPPEPPENMPVVTQTYSLLDSDPDEDHGLLELLTSLRRTVLPAHWVGVMAKGPLLQLFQCSKLSPMADTVLQIEKDYYYQINVQNQPLLLTHPVYERHPPRLTSASLVVALLLDLEELSVCQGYQSFEEGSHQTPLLCARAALCQLLIPQDEECCEKCQSPAKA
ncbi:methyl-CpG-binding domain protein 1a isoform X2 [Salminus brasiliensis]|uniref:methyl-CpG-binding domain protein 1a isoform X2 n=1 Tax=Salminus brasiliensis TaxID=930266 RepID=UPI003B82E5AD